MVIARLVITLNITDNPNHRSSHTKPTPRCGGIAILGAYFTSFILTQAFFTSAPSIDLQPWLVLHAAMFVFAVIGFMDDVYSLSSTKRFLMQIIVAAVTVIFADLSLTTLTIPGLNTVSLGILGTLGAMLWLIAYTNIFNFMDGLNGISGGVAIINFCFLAIIAYRCHNTLVCTATLYLMAATLGFLIYNFPHGRLFMGDVGSYFLGFTLAGFTLILLTYNPQSLSPWIFIILYFNYIFDTALTVIQRTLKGQNITIAHREHLYQRLQQSGWSHAQVSSLYGSMSAVQGFASLYCLDESARVQCWMLTVFLLIYSFYAFWVMEKFKTVELRHYG